MTGTPSDTVLYACGDINQCSTAPVVANSNNNVLKITLPTTMTSLGGPIIKHTLRVLGLAIPDTGFFSTRIGAQITDSSDKRPSYILSDGDYYYKDPDDGTTVAKIVAYYGDGNEKPFKSQSNNIVYLKLHFASTLFANSGDGDAGFSVEMPLGYNCTIPPQNDLLASEYNAWDVSWICFCLNFFFRKSC